MLGESIGRRLRRRGLSGEIDARKIGRGEHEHRALRLDSRAARVSHEIRESIIEWEPRAETVTIDVAPDPADESRLVISLVYRVRATNNVFNLVYPFYLQVGEAAR